MPEVDASEALQGQIDAAVAANDPALADALYQRQIGTTDLARSREPSEPMVDVPDEGKTESGDEPAGPSPSDVDQGMGGSRLADYKPYETLTEDERGQEFDRVFSLAWLEKERPSAAPVIFSGEPNG